MSERGEGYGKGTTVDFTGGEMPSALKRAQAMGGGSDGGDGPDEPQTSSTGLKIVVNNDGSVDIDIKAPAVKRARSKDDFHDNLAEDLSEMDRNALAADYLDGVAQDILSRSQFIQNYNRGIDLLGLKIEDASSARGSRQSISRVKSPALLQACTRSQSLARGQLLPATGPVKIVEIGGDTTNDDELARAMEADFNYYMTEIAKEYYPDTDRMLFYRAYGGSGYKKVYRCPLRQRPVSESVQIPDLIISEDATDLQNAIRKTNEIMTSPQTMKRMQGLGHWMDVPLSTPMLDGQSGPPQDHGKSGLSRRFHTLTRHAVFGI